MTWEVRELVQANRDALIETLKGFGELNLVDAGARGISHERWIQSLPLSAFRKEQA